MVLAVMSYLAGSPAASHLLSAHLWTPQEGTAKRPPLRDPSLAEDIMEEQKLTGPRGQGQTGLRCSRL